MTCTDCQIKNKRHLLCKLDLHKINKKLCPHEKGFNTCLRCGENLNWKDVAP